MSIDYYSYTQDRIIDIIVNRNIERHMHLIFRVIIERNYINAFDILMDKCKESDNMYRGKLGLFGTMCTTDTTILIQTTLQFDNYYCFRRICKLNRYAMLYRLPRITMPLKMIFHCLKLVSEASSCECTYELIKYIPSYYIGIGIPIETDMDALRYISRTELFNEYSHISQLLTSRGKDKHLCVLRDRLQIPEVLDYAEYSDDSISEDSNG